MFFAAGNAAPRTGQSRLTAVRFQMPGPAASEEPDTLGSPREESAVGNHDAAVTQAAELLAGPDPRRGSVMEGGRSGNRRASIAAGNLLRQLQVCWNSRIEFTATAVKVVCLIEMCTLVVCAGLAGGRG